MADGSEHRFFFKGEHCFEAGDYRRALRAFDQARCCAPHQRASLRRSAECYLRTGEPSAAVERLRKLVDLFPNDARGTAFLGYVLFRQGEAEEGAEFLVRALTLMEEEGTAYLGRAETYLEQGSQADAVSELDRARLACLCEGRLRQLLAKLYMDKERFADAIRTLRATELQKSREGAEGITPLEQR